MNFTDVMQFIFQEEGGYVNDPNDPGGETKYGISKRMYPSVDIKNLTIEEATDIYRRDYWDFCRCDDLPTALRLPVMDCAVNQGQVTAIKFLQTALRVTSDGVIGPVTIAAANRKVSAHIISEFTMLRIIRYFGTKNYDIYGMDWIARAVRSAMA